MLKLDYYGGDYNSRNDYLSAEGNKKVKKIGYDLETVNDEKVVNVAELIPTGGQKSFGGRAKIVTTDKGRYLLSYDTLVCFLSYGGRFVRLWDGYSVTTMKHINSFLCFVGWSICGGKAMWDKLEWGKRYTYDELVSLQNTRK